MAKKAYIGINGVSKNIPLMYIGVNGIAQKITKAYIGDENGIARLFYEATIPLDENLVLSLIDFEYTDNKDGTVTLTTWKNTLNGAASSELVIPDDPRIIL